MTATYDCIATTTLGSNTAFVEFSSISGTYTDLVLVCNAKTASNTSMVVRVGNGSVDTGTNYSNTVLESTGTQVRTASDSNVNAGFITGFYAQITAGNNILTTSNFQNYSNTTTHKTWINRGNVPAQWTDTSASLWRSTAAINVIRVFNNTGADLSSGSRFSLYGIKAE